MEALVTSRYSFFLVVLTICISALESEKSEDEPQTLQCQLQSVSPFSAIIKFSDIRAVSGRRTYSIWIYRDRHVVLKHQWVSKGERSLSLPPVLNPNTTYNVSITLLRKNNSRLWCNLTAITTPYLKSLSVEVCPSMSKPKYVSIYFQHRFKRGIVNYKCTLFRGDGIKHNLSYPQDKSSSENYTKSQCNSGIAILHLPKNARGPQWSNVAVEVEETLWLPNYPPQRSVFSQRISMEYVIEASVTHKGGGIYSVWCDLGCSQEINGCAVSTQHLQMLAYIPVTKTSKFHTTFAIHRVARGNFTHKQQGHRLPFVYVQAFSGGKVIGKLHYIVVREDSSTDVHGDVSQCTQLCSYNAISASAVLIGIFGVLFAILAILTVVLKIRGGRQSSCCKVRSKCNHRVFPDRNRMTNSRVVRLEPLNNTTHDDNENHHHFIVNLH